MSYISISLIFISRTYQKVRLVLTKQHVNTVAYLYLYYNVAEKILMKNQIHVCVIYIVTMITLQCNRNRIHSECNRNHDILKYS